MKRLPYKFGTRPTPMYPRLLTAADQHRRNSAIALQFGGAVVAIALRSQRGNQPWRQRLASSRKRVKDREVWMLLHQSFNLLVVGVNHFAQLANHTKHRRGGGNIGGGPGRIVSGRHSLADFLQSTIHLV